MPTTSHEAYEYIQQAKYLQYQNTSFTDRDKRDQMASLAHKSIELDPNNDNAYVNRGLAYFYLKQMNSACRDWQKASDMGNEKATEAVEQYCK